MDIVKVILIGIVFYSALISLLVICAMRFFGGVKKKEKYAKEHINKLKSSKK